MVKVLEARYDTLYAAVYQAVADAAYNGSLQRHDLDRITDSVVVAVRRLPRV